jgi:hypothetical protein
VHISVSFPSTRALSDKKRRIGECWHPKCSTSGHSQIFISPVLSDGVEVLATTVHELIHAVFPEAGHKGDFTKGMKAVGLAGKPTATVAGDELRPKLRQIIEQLGEYPHPRLNALVAPVKKQATRLVKCECQECGYTVRTTAKWLDQQGAPLCPCNQEPMTYEDDTEDDE